jgi:hypothetical protein
VSGHEFGHNPGTLADEYDEFFGTNTDYLSPQLGHVSNRKDPTTVPWAPYIPARSDLPISLPYSSGNGIYAGAYYNSGGAYRSNWNSRMRYTGPLYNDASVDILTKVFCIRSLTSEDFVGHKNPADPLLGLIFESGFEPEHGQITGLCH